MILTLDPSSTCIGYAVFTDAGDVREFGRITPSSTRIGADPLKRIPDLTAQARVVAREIVESSHEFLRVVIEVTTGKVHRRTKSSGGAGMGTYGMGVGYVWAAMSADGYAVHPVLEQAWTRGASKERRAWAVLQRYRNKGYRAESDPGMDIADAIGLGDWWFTDQQVKRAAAGA